MTTLAIIVAPGLLEIAYHKGAFSIRVLGRTI